MTYTSSPHRSSASSGGGGGVGDPGTRGARCVRGRLGITACCHGRTNLQGRPCARDMAVYKDVFNMVFMVMTTLLIAWGPIYSGDGLGSSFSYHPVLMAFGFCLHISLGFWMFNYEDLPGQWIDSRSARRQAHAACQMMGMVCIVLGFMAVILAHNSAQSATLLALNDYADGGASGGGFGFSNGPSWLKALHLVIGYFVLSLIPLQFLVGTLRFRALSDDIGTNDSAYAFHETIGNTLYGCGLLNVLLGLWMHEAWSFVLKCVITLLMTTSLVFGPRWDGSRGFLSNEQ